MIRSLLVPAPALATLGLATLVFATSCKGPETGVPAVQSSSDRPARTTVSLNRIIAGRYRSIAPSCVGQRYVITAPAPGNPGTVAPGTGLPIRTGDTVEFRNYMPDIPANITALEAPAAMFSPNLIRPYNFETEGEESFSFWRYTFGKPGVYEFFDTNMGEPGRKIVDSYYGTETFVGESDAPKGVVCVDAPGCVASLECLAGNAPAGTVCCSCPGVCCDSDANCGGGNVCLRGRCVDPATIE